MESDKTGNAHISVKVSSSLSLHELNSNGTKDFLPGIQKKIVNCTNNFCLFQFKT